MMNVAIIGLWHLGCVTAAAISDHVHVRAWDPDESTLRTLRSGKAPLFEPGLDDAIRAAIDSGRLDVACDASTAVSDADVVWVTFDTPVDDGDRPDWNFVVREVCGLFPYIRSGATVLVSSQVPVGTTRELQRAFKTMRDDEVTFACTPENLRLGQALDAFRNPGQIVVGIDAASSRADLSTLFAPLNGEIRWMAIESAEMTKHAINTFLAVSIAYINEVARLCEVTGADVREVESALRSEPRIGARAYVSPGTGFSGGTLGRDVAVLRDIAERRGVTVEMLDGVAASNELQRTWAERKLLEVFHNDLAGRSIAVLGLTYKPGTDTLRRSTAVELCQSLVTRGATVRAYDPAIRELPHGLRDIQLHESAAAALDGAEAAVIATEWSAFKQLQLEDLRRMRVARMFDPKGVIAADVRDHVQYFSVGLQGRTL